ncbi:MAG TPA: hypothetical protein VEZ88_10370, partial [Steroidobacteraceae bacterium]|nr:hypothetical protein [Steroidobacteraceae bacterium]
MPIIECDPWREQYFARVPCPDDVIVPTDDVESWRCFPAQRWVFNKLLICETQRIEHGPHGVEPVHYPVFSKPIYNLRGMGAGSRLIRTREEYLAAQAPGHMWMTLLEGEHLSTDVAVVQGEPEWWRHARGEAAGEGTFDHWHVMSEGRPALEATLARWLRTNLPSYTGMANFETIGGAIIECHLRFADQWPDLYGGDPWVSAVVELYAAGRWRYEERQRRDGFSVVAWSPHSASRRAPPAALVAALLQNPELSSVQIT